MLNQQKRNNFEWLFLYSDFRLLRVKVQIRKWYLFIIHEHESKNCVLFSQNERRLSIEIGDNNKNNEPFKEKIENEIDREMERKQELKHLAFDLDISVFVGNVQNTNWIVWVLRHCVNVSNTKIIFAQWLRLSCINWTSKISALLPEVIDNFSIVTRTNKLVETFQNGNEIDENERVSLRIQ